MDEQTSGTDAYNVAFARFQTDPLHLTDADIDCLAGVNPQLADDAINARRLAILGQLPDGCRPAITTKAVEPTAGQQPCITRKEFTAHTTVMTEAIGKAIVEVAKMATAPLKAALKVLMERVERLEAERQARDTERRDYDARLKQLELFQATESRLRALERAAGLSAHVPEDVQ